MHKLRLLDTESCLTTRTVVLQNSGPLQVQIIGPDGEDVIVVDQRQLYRCDSCTCSAIITVRPLRASAVLTRLYCSCGGCCSKYGWPAGEAIKEALQKIEID